MNFRFKSLQLNVARRYLWGALVAALIPLIAIAALYDRYSANLLNNLIANRVNANLEATAARMNNFMSVQVNRLENIVDLTDTAAFFHSGTQGEVSELLEDILRLEAESTDIYAIELSDIEGNVLKVFPDTQKPAAIAGIETLPWIQHANAELLGPVLPQSGRPGWFRISMPVQVNQQAVGKVSLRMRLSSLTEQAAPLIEPGVYFPQIVVFERIHLTAAGTPDEPGQILAKSRQFFPGWRIHLVEGHNRYQEPKTFIRYLLLLAAALSVLCLVYMFFQMSQKLSGHLQPLSQGARAIANGNFNVSVSEDAPGELGVLARSYNRMRLQLGTLIDSRVDVERRAALGNMAAGIAHEIRNPLTTVSNTVHGLKLAEHNSDRVEMLDVISSEIDRVDATISEFLNYARPSVPQKEQLLLRDLFKFLKTLIAATAHEKDIKINVSGESNLRVYVDETHCRQILLNLALNAIEAMPEGGHLTLRAYREKETAVIVITDDGVGMDADLQSKVMRPFFTTRANGNGLGLSVTYQLVEANAGTLEIESEMGEGTTVLVRLPMSKGQEAKTQ